MTIRNYIQPAHLRLKADLANGMSDPALQRPFWWLEYSPISLGQGCHAPQITGRTTSATSCGSATVTVARYLL